MHTCCIPNPVRIPLLNRDYSITCRSNPTFLPFSPVIARRCSNNSPTLSEADRQLLLQRKKESRASTTISIPREVENLGPLRDNNFSTPFEQHGRVAGKYTLKKICIIIPREEEFYLPRKGPPLHARQPRHGARRPRNNARNKCKVCGREEEATGKRIYHDNR